MEDKRKYYNEKWRKEHPEYIKEYKEKHKEKISQYLKEYYKTHNPNEKITCQCGAITSKSCLSRHRKTKKHLNYEMQELIKSLDNDLTNLDIDNLNQELKKYIQSI